MTDQQQNQPEQPDKKQRSHKPRGRSKGEGSVFKRSDPTRNKPWVAQITRENGKKETIGYFKTEAEAISERNKALRNLEQGAWVAKSRQTMEEYLNYWLENVHKATVELTSYDVYRKGLDSRIIPALGHTQVQKLTTRQVQMFYSKLINEEGLGASRVQFLHALIHSALDHAVKENVVVKNVCDGVKLPRIKKREQRVLSPEEATQLLKSTQNSEMRIIVLLAVVTGMRQGELLALKWQDIDIKKRLIQIRHSLAYIRGKGLVEKRPKSEHSRREVSLPFFVVDALTKHREEQEEARIRDGDAWQDHSLVFGTKHGAHMFASTLQARFKKLLKSANLPLDMRFHDLRHSAVTILLKMGVPPHVVQEIVGHSNVNITLRVYGHVLPGQQESAMEKWTDVLGGQVEERYASLRLQWGEYSIDVQTQLEELLKSYGEGAVRIAINLINLLK
ncbi:MAG TPA: tyrosine-type recombinase/integrase [Ktedonobacteraceae bacterium]|nr:tyrosine-type recombinase/integrase [Ktedonobacteraceae bacterium]